MAKMLITHVSSRGMEFNEVGFPSVICEYLLLPLIKYLRWSMNGHNKARRENKTECREKEGSQAIVM